MSNSVMNRLRRLGVLLPVFSLQRENDLGIGDTLALREAVDWAAEYKVGFLQLLPINETGADSSPYNAISSIALDPMLIAMDLIPGIEKSAIQAEHEGCVHAELVDYDSVKSAKWRLLERGFEVFCESGAPDADFKLFCATEKDWLVPYTQYRWLMEQTGTEVWQHWPEHYNTAEKARAWMADQAMADQGCMFYAWVQWHASMQWRELNHYAEDKGVKLMGDIPIGISYSSADVFFEPQWFDLTLSGGSPPEAFFKDDAFACQWGQNWGIPLYNWENLEQHDFIWWRRRIEKLTDVFHIFRIDHILGFYRIYSFPWFPNRNTEFLGLSEAAARELTGGILPGFHPREDDTAENRELNRAAGDKYLKVVIDAASESEVVGEDLGCVPDYVRPHLEELGIAGFKVCHWEMQEDGQVRSGAEYPECSFATFATHDHDSLPAMWNGLKAVLENTEREGAMRGLAILSDFAGLPSGGSIDSYPDYGPEVKWALLERLLSCQSNYAAIMITDLIDSVSRMNIPGTVGGENWRYRLPWQLNQMPSSLRMECLRMRDLISRTGRS